MATATRRKKGKGATRDITRGGTKQARRASAKRPPRSPRPKPGPVNEWFELRRSPIHGVGAFATVPVPKGTRIVEHTGEKISNAEADRRYDDDAMRRHHTFLFILDKRSVVDAAYAGNEARFINHSCDPNCETIIARGHIWIEAMKAIPPGDELTYDYAYDDDKKYTAEDYRFYGCQCGAPNCRGTIVNTRRKWRA